MSALFLLLADLLLELAATLLASKLHGLGSDPLDVVLLEAFDEVDTLEHIRDIVDTSLLHAENGLCPVEVKALRWLRAQQTDELVR